MFSVDGYAPGITKKVSLDYSLGYVYSIELIARDCVMVSDGHRDKYIKVVECFDGWVYKTQKIQIKAKDAAIGLVNHFSDDVYRFMLVELIKYALDNMKTYAPQSMPYVA